MFKILQMSQNILLNKQLLLNIWTTLKSNKKVLLCERKSHTARRVASTRHAVPIGGTPPILRPDLDGGCPLPRSGWWGTPSQVWMGLPPSQVRTGGVPPSQVWMQGRGYPPSRPGKGVPPIQTWERGIPIRKDVGTPCQEGCGYPLSGRMGFPQSGRMAWPHPPPSGRWG